jgi:tetratricopeptide (TPR) repeat protein
LCDSNARVAEFHGMLGLVYGQLGKFEEAAECFRRVVSLEPSAVIGHRGLGEALKARRDFAGAEACFREVLRLQPNASEVVLELAGVLLEQERLSQAEQCLRDLLGSDPRHAEAYLALGEIYHVWRRLPEAIGSYKRALQIKPDLARGHYRLGVALHSLGRPRDAVPCYEEALRLAPGVVEVHTALGQVLAECAQAERAREEYARALAVEPGCVPAIVGQAALLEREGHLLAAYDQVAPLVDRGVEDTALITTYANMCGRLGRDGEGIARLEAVLATRTLRASAEEDVRLALGKLYDRSGCYNEAFCHFQKANELRSTHYDADAHVAAVDEILATYDKEFLARAPRATHGSRRPVFIVGMPRSGTSLTEQILSSHPRVFGAGELGDITRMAGEVAASVGGQRDYRLGVRRLTQERVDALAGSYLARLAELDSEAARVTDKLPQNYQHLGLIALLFPQAKVIHCLRDPRDVCLSIYFQNFAEGHTYAHNLEWLGLYYRQYQRLMEYWRGVLDISMLEMRYEELVADQEGMSRQLIEFIGLDWDERCLAFHKTERLVVTPSHEQVRRPLYTSSVGRWRHYEWAIGPLTRALGMGVEA